MLEKDTRYRQELLKQHIKTMASYSMDRSAINDMAEKLKDIYANNFRHIYSEFFPLIVDICESKDGYDSMYLTENLKGILCLIEESFVNGENKFQGLYKPLFKLNDHLNLDIARYDHSQIPGNQIAALERQTKDLEGKLAALKTENSNLESKLKDAQTSLSAATSKIGSIHTDLITVLSVFAAIVFAFSGSMTLLGNALSGMQAAPFFKSVFFILLCGFVICNTIFLMMYLVAKITDHNIYAKCKSDDCTCSPKCRSYKRIANRLPYVFWLNITLIALMVADIVIWWIDNVHNFIP